MPLIQINQEEEAQPEVTQIQEDQHKKFEMGTSVPLIEDHFKQNAASALDSAAADATNSAVADDCPDLNDREEPLEVEFQVPDIEEENDNDEEDNVLRAKSNS